MSNSVALTKKMCVLGIGGAGVKIVSQLSNLHMDGLKLVVVDKEFKEDYNNIHSLIHFSDGEKTLSEINAYINDADDIVLFAGLGRGIGTTGIRSLIENEILNQKTNIHAFVFSPFLFEGEKARSIAEETILLLKDAGVQVSVLENDSLYKDEDTRHLPIYDMMKAGNKKLVEMFINTIA